MAAEEISHPPYNLNYTHNSLGRVEKGKQMPPIGLIEALAKLYNTDIESLLNRAPKQGPGGANEIIQLWDEADQDSRNLVLGVAKKMR